jgi:hypothetical protein
MHFSQLTLGKIKILSTLFNGTEFFFQACNLLTGQENCRPLWSKGSSPPSNDPATGFRHDSIDPIHSFTLSCNLCVAMPSYLFPSDFPIKILYAFLIIPWVYMPIPCDPWCKRRAVTMSGTKFKSRSFLQPPITFFVVNPSILLSILTSNTVLFARFRILGL